MHAKAAPREHERPGQEANVWCGSKDMAWQFVQQLVYGGHAGKVRILRITEVRSIGDYSPLSTGSLSSKYKIITL